MVDKILDPAQDTPTPGALHDAAITATEAWQANPTPELKEVAVGAVAKAKESLKDFSKKPVAPEKYDLKPKEGSTISAEHLEKISAYSKAKGFSNEDAQALLDRDQENFSSITTAQKAQVEKVKESWLPAAQADEEIGGDKFSKSSEMAKRVVDRVGSDSFKEFLSETGFGNHPEVIRVFSRLGNMMSEDQLVVGQKPPGGDKVPTEKLLYTHPSSNK